MTVEQTVSEFFPPFVRDMLMRAARTPIDTDPLARQKAIERAIDRARQMCPERFKPEAA